jgi:hypothetical protein
MSLTSQQKKGIVLVDMRLEELLVDFHYLLKIIASAWHTASRVLFLGFGFVNLFFLEIT